MINLLDNTIKEAKTFCNSLGIDFDEILQHRDPFSKVFLFEKYLNILLDKDQDKEEFKIYANLCRNIYSAGKPEVFEMDWENKYLSIILYLDDMIRASTRDERLENAKIQLGRNLDFRVKADQVAENINPLELVKEIQRGKPIRYKFKRHKKKDSNLPYKNIEIQIKIIYRRKARTTPKGKYD